jgi:putative PEP-CTERM system histidine kinase
MTDQQLALEVFGYGLVAALYGAAVILILASYRGRLRSAYFAVALGVTALWGAVYASFASQWLISPLVLLTTESAIDIAWLVFLASLLAGSASSLTSTVIRFGGVILAVGVLLVGVALHVLSPLGDDQAVLALLIPGQILTSLAVLVALEQVFRNSRSYQRRSLKFLCVFLGTIFSFDLFMYASSVASSALSSELWVARGYVVALVLPLAFIALRRAPDWGGGIFVSRQIVFHSATILITGVFLTAIGVVGTVLRGSSYSWGGIAQVAFIAVALAGLVVLFASERLRSSLRVFLSKHFFENKYDYRKEWLQLIDTLTASDDGLPLRKRAIRAVADVLESDTGVLWLKTPGGKALEPTDGWNTSLDGRDAVRSAELIDFLESSGWVIDSLEYKQHNHRYPSGNLPVQDLLVDGATIIVPMLHEEHLVGLICIAAPSPPRALDYEDRDLLKAAGKQVASYLAQEQATEALAQSRQFEAFNRLTAYMMHDLKNVTAQQALVVENAQKHARNPEFVDDAIETIRGGVARMRRMLEQLRQASLPGGDERVELGATIMRAISLCDDREPVPRASLGEERIWVRGNAERLQMAIYHALRNAQDATPADGRIDVHLSQNASASQIVIGDTGIGMDPRFVRERLFRPFDSTKGTKGMGIGAHQIRETVESIGGHVTVESEPGRGTSITLELPAEPASRRDSTVEHNSH